MKHSRLVCIFLVFASATLLAQVNPVPLIYQPLTPAVVAPGHATFTLTVRGTAFVHGASVQWNGTPLKTQSVSAQILKAQVPAKLVSAASTASITVKNPGVIASNVIYFSVIELACGFHPVGYLPDGSNTRFTISESARLEVLRRLSKLNKTQVDQQSQPGKAIMDRSANDTSTDAASLEDDLFARGSKT